MAASSASESAGSGVEAGVTDRATAATASEATVPLSHAYRVTGWVFPRLLGLVYGLAFLSLWSQVIGLIGHDGILPADQYLTAVEAHLGTSRLWLCPTLCWISDSNGMLHVLCTAGVLCSGCAMIGIAPRYALAVLWIFYLSLVSVGQAFLNYQWDVLLLEAGFIGFLMAPSSLGFHRLNGTGPAVAVVLLLRLLLFKLMFLSGTVKLASHDEVWWDLSALTVHYQTQPLPTWIGWYAHQLSYWIQWLCCFIMFIVELIMPFFIFGTRGMRWCAFALFIGFQIAIALTGNYCFFNLLTIALCISLLDDASWVRVLPAKICTRLCAQVPRRRRLAQWSYAATAAVIATLSLSFMMLRLMPDIRFPEWLRTVLVTIQPFRTINTYGLFADMTTRRLEIVIEGSMDGQHWQCYEFKYKPGDVNRRPVFVAPHQPRLDWQMWFAALQVNRIPSWYGRFVMRILEGSPSVLSLLEHNPFPDQPPRYVRSMLYEYRFTDSTTRQATRAWWQRSTAGMYAPAVSLPAAAK